MLFAVLVLAVIIIVIAVRSRHGTGFIYESGEKRAGRLGEEIASDAISQILREDDHLFTNVSISYQDKQTELDNVIVSKYGVFIIEVKNYKGTLAGNENDYEWVKLKTTSAGNTYEKTVRNPIRQVRRQIYILARYLAYYGAKVWVKGYVMLLRGNSPVDSDYILHNIEEVDRAIHTPGRERLNMATVRAICGLLE